MHPPPSKRKLVVRQLPPSYTESEFKEQMIKPFEQWIDHWSFTPGKEQKNITDTAYLSSSDSSPRYSTGYAAFTDPRQLLEFAKKMHGRKLCDEARVEYEVLVDTAPYQLIPSPGNDVVDELEGTFDELPEFQAYMAREEPKCEPVTLEALQASLSEKQKIAPLVEHLKTKVSTGTTQATSSKTPIGGKKKKSKASTSAAFAMSAKTPMIKIASRGEKKSESRADQVGQLANQTASMALKDSVKGRIVAPATTGDHIQALGKKGAKATQAVQAGSSKTVDVGGVKKAVEKQHAANKHAVLEVKGESADIAKKGGDVAEKPLKKKGVKTTRATPVTEATTSKAPLEIKPAAAFKKGPQQGAESEIERQEKETLVKLPDQMRHEEKQKQLKEPVIGHARFTTEEGPPLGHKVPREELKIFNSVQDDLVKEKPQAAQGEPIKEQPDDKVSQKQPSPTKPPRPLQSTASKKHPHLYTEDDRKWILDVVHHQQPNDGKSTDTERVLQQDAMSCYIELGGDQSLAATFKPLDQSVFPTKEASPKKTGAKKKSKPKPKDTDESILPPTKQSMQASKKTMLRKENASSLLQGSSGVSKKSGDKEVDAGGKTVHVDAVSKAPASVKNFKTKGSVVSSVPSSQTNTASPQQSGLLINSNSSNSKAHKTSSSSPKDASK